MCYSLIHNLLTFVLFWVFSTDLRSAGTGTRTFGGGAEGETDIDRFRSPSSFVNSNSFGGGGNPRSSHKSFVGLRGRDRRATRWISVKYPLKVSDRAGSFRRSSGSAIVQPKLMFLFALTRQIYLCLSSKSFLFCFRLYCVSSNHASWYLTALYVIVTKYSHTDKTACTCVF